MRKPLVIIGAGEFAQIVSLVGHSRSARRCERVIGPAFVNLSACLSEPACVGILNQ
ncbi:hypothetical protein GGR76_000907 [Xanthomonas translucens]|nr:hypothetical protein [Xanthomonas campestris]